LKRQVAPRRGLRPEGLLVDEEQFLVVRLPVDAVVLSRPRPRDRPLGDGLLADLIEVGRLPRESLRN